MARKLSRADESQRGSRRWERDWIAYDKYVNVHTSHLESLQREGVVEHDTLTFVQTVDPQGAVARVHLEGVIHWCRGVRVEVSKWLRARQGRRNRCEVLAESYGYHALQKREGWIEPKSLLRYDNAHGPLHRHWFDENGNETRTEPVTIETMPRLDAVIREAVNLAVERG